MKVILWSKSIIGRAAFILTLISVVLILLKLIGSSFRLPFPTPAVAAVGLIGFILGVIAVSRFKDRSVLTLLTIPVGVLILIWLAMELLF